jgi:hypothetical protein
MRKVILAVLIGAMVAISPTAMQAAHASVPPVERTAAPPEVASPQPSRSVTGPTSTPLIIGWCGNSRPGSGPRWEEIATFSGNTWQVACNKCEQRGEYEKARGRITTYACKYNYVSLTISHLIVKWKP